VVRVLGYSSGFDSRRYQIFWEVVGLERGPLSLVSTTEELLERKRSSSGPETQDYGRRDLSHWPRGTLYPQTFALTSSTRGGHLVGIVLLQTQATEFSFSSALYSNSWGSNQIWLLLKHTHSLFPHSTLVSVPRTLVMMWVGHQSSTHSQQCEGLNLKMCSHLRLNIWLI
jgi:hypothetical protein